MSLRWDKQHPWRYHGEMNNKITCSESLLLDFVKLSNEVLESQRFEEAESYANFMIGINPTISTNNVQFNKQRAHIFETHLLYLCHIAKDNEKLRQVLQRASIFNDELKSLRKTNDIRWNIHEFENFGILIWDFELNLPSVMNEDIKRHNVRSFLCLSVAAVAVYHSPLNTLKYTTKFTRVNGNTLKLIQKLPRIAFLGVLVSASYVLYLRKPYVPTKRLW